MNSSVLVLLSLGDPQNCLASWLSSVKILWGRNFSESIFLFSSGCGNFGICFCFWWKNKNSLREIQCKNKHVFPTKIFPLPCLHPHNLEFLSLSSCFSNQLNAFFKQTTNWKFIYYSFCLSKLFATWVHAPLSTRLAKRLS